jgi:N utilization substance protein A
MSALDLEEILAQLLASEGYNSIQSLADAEIAEIASIEGLDEDIAQELISRARNYAEENTDAQTDLTKAAAASAKVNPKLYDLEGMTEEIAAELYAGDVKTLEDIADLASDELIEKMVSAHVEKETADKIIMSARDKVYFSKEN